LATRTFLKSFFIRGIRKIADLVGWSSAGHG
jgi:hypothetical protein